MAAGKVSRPRSYVTPLTLKIYDALPSSPVQTGLGFAIVLLVVFLLGGAIVGDALSSAPSDFRLAIVHLLLAAYLSFAYAYLLITVRRSAAALAPSPDLSPVQQDIVGRVGSHPWWALLLAGGSAILMIIPTTIETTTAGTDPWDWRGFSYEVWWHRLVGPFFWWWGGCLFYATLAESARLSRLSESLGTVDLFDLRPFQPLIRQGLTNALLVIGIASVASLFMLEPGYNALLVWIWVTLGGFAWIGLMLPLRGIRARIRTAKAEELDWCRESLKSARTDLKLGKEGTRSIAELIAYTERVEAIRNWPFDNPTLVRFALYLLIPLGSWTGGAMVEYGLGRYLF